MLAAINACAWGGFWGKKPINIGGKVVVTCLMKKSQLYCYVLINTKLLSAAMKEAGR